jgi:Zn-dependent protease with chaperone function
MFTRLFVNLGADVRKAYFAKMPRLIVAVVCVGIAGCANAQSENRSRMIGMPLVSNYADIAFTLTTGSRQSATCNGDANCPTQSDRDAARRFAVQVRRVAGALQKGAQLLYPDLAQRVPGMVGSQFDVYVVEGDKLGSESSANGRIALNAALGARQPYDDWMAFVIAREMGHVIARHHEANSGAGIATSVIMNILIPGSGLLKSLVSAGGSGIAAKSQRDVQALEADAIAMNLLEAAGFRLRDISLTLLIEPVLLDEGSWSKSFRDSSDHLLAVVQRPEFDVVAVR